MSSLFDGLGLLAYPSAHAKSPRPDVDAAVHFVRGMPRNLLAKLKAAAALHQNTLGGYIKEMCEEHVQELERKGLLPKGK
jgi:hypothetical protein